MKLSLIVLLLLLIPRDTHQDCSTVGCLEVIMDDGISARIPSAYAVAHQFPQASHCQPTVKDQYHHMNKCLDGCNVQVSLSSNPQYNINPTYQWHYDDNFWNVVSYDQSTTTQYPNEQCQTEDWLVWDGSVRHIPAGSARDYPTGFCKRRLTSRDNSDVHGFWDYGYRNADFTWTGVHNQDDMYRDRNECNLCAVGYPAVLGTWEGLAGGYGTYFVSYSLNVDHYDCVPAPAGYCAPYKFNIHSQRYACAVVAITHISDLYKNNGDEAYGLFDTTISNGARGWQYNFYLDGCESGFCGSITQCSAYMYGSCPSGSTLHNTYQSVWSSHSTYYHLGSRQHSPPHDGPWAGRCKCPAGEYLANCAGWNRGFCKPCGSCPSGTFEVMPCNDWFEELSVDQIWTARNPNGPPICTDCWSFSNRCEIGQFLQGCSGTSTGTCVWCSQHACEPNHYRVGCGSTCGHDPKTTPWRTWDANSNDFFYVWGSAQSSSYSDITPSYLMKGESSGCTSTEGECVACPGCPTNEERVGCSGTNAGSCSACAAGKYKPDAGNGPCIPCVTCYANTYNSACGSCTACGPNTHKIGTTYATSCSPCTICPQGMQGYGCGTASAFDGSFLDGGPGRCADCYSNSYKDWEGHSYCTTCTSCNSGQYESQACTASTNRACASCSSVNCGLGQILVGCGHGSIGSCDACPWNHYTAGSFLDGCTQCRDCGDGKYETGLCNANGQDRQCSTCSPGCGAGFWESTPCTSTTNRVCTACLQCPAGSTMDGCGGSTKGLCVADAGFEGNSIEGFSPAAYSTNNCNIPGYCGGITQCAPGWYKNSPGDYPCVPCLGCGENQYKDGCNPVTGSICRNCPTGYTSPPNSVGSSSCQTCAVSTANSPTSCANMCRAPPGYVIASDGNSLTRCEEGTYNSGTTGVTCTGCPAGKSSPEGSDSIYDCVCDRGKYLLSGSCEECGEGTYKQTMGNDFCEDCPTSSTTTGDTTTGADSITDCLCKAGYEADHLGDCVVCPGTSDKFIVSDDACIQCGENQTLNSDLPHQQSSCECNEGFTGTYLDCQACPTGSFKSTKGSANCVSCADHATTPTSASTSIAACACEGPMWVPSETGPDEVGGTCQAACGPGETAQNNVCVPCSEGTYKSVQGLEACTECVDPRNSSSPGATNAAHCSCPQGKIALGGNFVQIVSVGLGSDISTIDCGHSSQSCTIDMQPNQRLKSVELTGSGHQHISITTNGMKVFVCTTDCDLFAGEPIPLPNIRGNTQILATSGELTVSLFNGRAAVFSDDAPWMDEVQARSLISSHRLGPGDFLLDSTSLLHTPDACIDCVKGFICKPYITLQ